MRKFFYDNFSQYLRENGVRRVNFILKDNEALSRKSLEDRVIAQLKLISEFHRISCGFNGYLKSRINNDTCKLIEDYKVQIKKLCKNIERIKSNGPQDEVEEFIAEEGSTILNRAEEVINYINNNNYIDLIARSMKNVEICLTDVEFDNLKKEEVIEIVNFEDIAYNMVEMDAYYLLSKLKRRGYNLDFKKCIKEFCRCENLGEDSMNLILALISYPCEFMSIYEKYKKNKKNWSSGEYLRRMKNAIREDGNSLIGDVNYDRG